MLRIILKIRITDSGVVGKRIKTVDQYIAKSNDFAKPILISLRDQVHTSCPEVEESIKWSFPFFSYDGQNLCAMQAFKAHCNFSFWNGKYMKDPNKVFKVMEKGSMGTIGNLKSIEDIPSKKILNKYIDEAIKLCERGVKKSPKPVKVKAKLVAPKELISQLKKNKVALKHWEAFSPSKRQDYIEWIVTAKREATKEKRLITTVEQVTEGKSRNWKYEK